MITFTLVVILGAALGIVLMRLFKKQPAAQSGRNVAGPEPQDLANLKITDARAGDVISISGAGDGMTDLDFTSDRLLRVEAGARRWFELSGPYRDRRVAVRVAGDEEVETALHAAARKITLEDLGLSGDDMAQMDERQNTADSFEFDGKVWFYRLSREAHAWRDGEPRPAGFYYWEFQQENGPGMLAIKKAEGEPFTVSEYAAIPPDNITVYRR